MPFGTGKFCTAERVGRLHLRVGSTKGATGRFARANGICTAALCGCASLRDAGRLCNFIAERVGTAEPCGICGRDAGVWTEGLVDVDGLAWDILREFGLEYMRDGGEKGAIENVLEDAAERSCESSAKGAAVVRDCAPFGR